MWVIASVCPTVGSQIGQIPCIFRHFCSIRPSHGKKRGSWISFKTIFPSFYQIYWQYGQSKGRIWFFQDHLIPFKTIAFGVFLCIFSPFLAPFQASPSQTSPNTSKFKFSHSIVYIVSIVHPYEQI